MKHYFYGFLHKNKFQVNFRISEKSVVIYTVYPGAGGTLGLHSLKAILIE